MPGLLNVACKFIRQYWWSNRLNSVSIIADSDRGPIYEKCIGYMTLYINTHCKMHNITFNTTQLNSEKIQIDYGHGKTIKLWTVEVPINLDRQISLITNDVEITEDLIKSCVSSSFNGRRWYNTFCNRLSQKL
jgi:hypothetical protein